MQIQKKILAVDDNPTNIKILKKLLAEDYDLKTATTGEEALEIAKEFIPDLILLDIMMPGMDGYEVCRQIRANETLRYIKVIMVSAKAMTTERLEGYEAGADDYIIKPFDDDELLAKVRVYLRLKSIEELDHMRRQFTSTVTHEMRTPMTVVKCFISSALEEVYGKINPELRQQLQIANRNMDQLAGIISNFFDIAEIDAGKTELQPTRFSIQSVVLEVVNLLKPKADLRKIELSTDMPTRELLVDADQKKIAKILIHLIGNAIKFTCEHDNINVRVKDLQNKFHIDVEDNGPGIESDKIDEVFDRFVQVEKQVGPGEHGTGLGLAVAKGLVELHSGRIWAENRPAGGAVFSFEIPFSEGAKMEELVTIGANYDSNAKK